MEEICRFCENFYFICTGCAEGLNLPTAPSSSPVGSVETKGEVCVRCGRGGELRLVSRETYCAKTREIPHKRRVHSYRKL